MTSMPPSTMATGRQRLLSLTLRLLGILLAPLLLWWTVSRTAASPLDALAGARWPLVLGALLCVGMTHVLGAWRWGLSLAVQGVPCTPACLPAPQSALWASATLGEERGGDGPRDFSAITDPGCLILPDL